MLDTQACVMVNKFFKRYCAKLVLRRFGLPLRGSLFLLLKSLSAREV